MKKHRSRTKPKEVLLPVDSNLMIAGRKKLSRTMTKIIGRPGLEVVAKAVLN